MYFANFTQIKDPAVPRGTTGRKDRGAPAAPTRDTPHTVLVSQPPRPLCLHGSHEQVAHPWVPPAQGPTSPAPLWYHPHRHQTGSPGRPGGRWPGPQRAGLGLVPPGPVGDRWICLAAGPTHCPSVPPGQGSPGRCTKCSGFQE